MKSIEYLEINANAKVEEQKKPEILIKQEDKNLPSFVRLPTGKKKKITEDSITINYRWDVQEETEESNTIRISSIEFRKKEQLEDLYRLSIEDGKDTALIKHNGITYIIRKTTKAVAKSLYNVYTSISSFVENIMGHFKTVLGNFYVMSKLENNSWVLDEEIAESTHVNLLNLKNLKDQQKKRLFELIIEKLFELHKKALILGSFTMKNIILTNNSLLFTDLRSMRLTRKRSLLVEEFKQVIRYLFAAGLVNKDDVYHAIATYNVIQSDACNEWYKEYSKNKDAKIDYNDYSIVLAMELEVYS